MKSTKQEQEAMKQELPKRKKKSSYNYDKYEWGENMREEMNSNSRKWNLISLIKSKQKKLNRKRMKQKKYQIKETQYTNTRNSNQRE